jgi:hypothetical protein
VTVWLFGERMAMAKAVFLVLASQDRWWIDFDGAATGPFPSRAAAIVAAIPMAQQAEKSGRTAEVLAPGDDKRHHVAWPPHATRRRLESSSPG